MEAVGISHMGGWLDFVSATYWKQGLEETVMFLCAFYIVDLILFKLIIDETLFKSKSYCAKAADHPHWVSEWANTMNF